ncbi:hypothetical protein GCM10022227_03750 [Streptomyces sedi]
MSGARAILWTNEQGPAVNPQQKGHASPAVLPVRRYALAQERRVDIEGDSPYGRIVEGNSACRNFGIRFTRGP